MVLHLITLSAPNSNSINDPIRASNYPTTTLLLHWGGLRAAFVPRPRPRKRMQLTRAAEKSSAPRNKIDGDGDMLSNVIRKVFSTLVGVRGVLESRITGAATAESYCLRWPRQKSRGWVPHRVLCHHAPSLDANGRWYNARINGAVPSCCRSELSTHVHIDTPLLGDTSGWYKPPVD